jgi:hypothetical protein
VTKAVIAHTDDAVPGAYNLVRPPEAASIYRSAEQHVHRLVEQLGHLPAASLCWSCRW